MPDFAPFSALRYDVEVVDLAEVTAPPYDVISAAEREELLSRHPANIVGVDLPAGAPGSPANEQGDVYRQAAETFASWRRDGLITQDPEPCFYTYRMTHQDEAGNRRHTTGVMGALTLARPGESIEGQTPILPHEQTTPKAKTDRLELLRATGVNLSPIWGLSPASGLTDLLTTGAPPLASWSDGDGVLHELWRLVDPERISAIAKVVSSEPMVIADGHHRFETSLAYRDERRAADGAPERPGAGNVRPWDAALFYVVELSPSELTVLPIHRLVRGLPEGTDLPEAMAPFYDLSPIEGPDGRPALVTSSGTWAMSPKPGAFEGVRDLETSRLDAALATLPPNELTYQHGVGNVVAQVADGSQQAGFLLDPATVGQIIDIAHGGERMPPKTTFFHPKPRTGVIFRPAASSLAV